MSDDERFRHDARFEWCARLSWGCVKNVAFNVKLRSTLFLNVFFFFFFSLILHLEKLQYVNPAFCLSGTPRLTPLNSASPLFSRVFSQLSCRPPSSPLCLFLPSDSSRGSREFIYSPNMPNLTCAHRHKTGGVGRRWRSPHTHFSFSSISSTWMYSPPHLSCQTENETFQPEFWWAVCVWTVSTASSRFYWQ